MKVDERVWYLLYGVIVALAVILIFFGNANGAILALQLFFLARIAELLER